MVSSAEIQARRIADRERLYKQTGTYNELAQKNLERQKAKLNKQQQKQKVDQYKVKTTVSDQGKVERIAKYTAEIEKVNESIASTEAEIKANQEKIVQAKAKGSDYWKTVRTRLFNRDEALSNRLEGFYEERNQWNRKLNAAKVGRRTSEQVTTSVKNAEKLEAKFKGAVDKAVDARSPLPLANTDERLLERAKATGKAAEARYALNKAIEEGRLTNRDLIPQGQELPLNSRNITQIRQAVAESDSNANRNSRVDWSNSGLVNNNSRNSSNNQTNQEIPLTQKRLETLEGQTNAIPNKSRSDRNNIRNSSTSNNPPLGEERSSSKKSQNPFSSTLISVDRFLGTRGDAIRGVLSQKEENIKSLEAQGKKVRAYFEKAKYGLFGVGIGLPVAVVSDLYKDPQPALDTISSVPQETSDFVMEAVKNPGLRLQTSVTPVLESASSVEGSFGLLTNSLVTAGVSNILIPKSSVPKTSGITSGIKVEAQTAATQAVEGAAAKTLPVGGRTTYKATYTEKINGALNKLRGKTAQTTLEKTPRGGIVRTQVVGDTTYKTVIPEGSLDATVYVYNKGKFVGSEKVAVEGVDNLFTISNEIESVASTQGARASPSNSLASVDDYRQASLTNNVLKQSARRSEIVPAKTTVGKDEFKGALLKDSKSTKVSEAGLTQTRKEVTRTVNTPVESFTPKVNQLARPEPNALVDPRSKGIIDLEKSKIKVLRDSQTQPVAASIQRTRLVVADDANPVNLDKVSSSNKRINIEAVEFTDEGIKSTISQERSFQREADIKNVITESQTVEGYLAPVGKQKSKLGRLFQGFGERFGRKTTAEEGARLSAEIKGYRQSVQRQREAQRSAAREQLSVLEEPKKETLQVTRTVSKVDAPTQTKPITITSPRVKPVSQNVRLFMPVDAYVVSAPTNTRPRPLSENFSQRETAPVLDSSIGQGVSPTISVGTKPKVAQEQSPQQKSIPIISPTVDQARNQVTRTQQAQTPLQERSVSTAQAQAQSQAPILRESTASVGSTLAVLRMQEAKGSRLYSNPRRRGAPFDTDEDDDKKRKEEGYIALVRQFGNFVIQNTQALSYKDARNLAIDKVSTTPAASFKVVAAGKSVQASYKRKTPSMFDANFRPSKRDPTVTVEKRSKRIKSAGEKQGITQKGIFASKKRRKK